MVFWVTGVLGKKGVSHYRSYFSERCFLKTPLRKWWCRSYQESLSLPKPTILLGESVRFNYFGILESIEGLYLSGVGLHN